ncbi:MAG: hypothetical protein IJD27_02410, partial [Alistipes sp.]|nr:hypothetical protein [Alistipes sp.]
AVFNKCSHILELPSAIILRIFTLYRAFFDAFFIQKDISKAHSAVFHKTKSMKRFEKWHILYNFAAKFIIKFTFLFNNKGI